MNCFNPLCNRKIEGISYVDFRGKNGGKRFYCSLACELFRNEIETNPGKLFENLGLHKVWQEKLNRNLIKFLRI